MAHWLTNWGRKGWTRGSDGTAVPNKNIYILEQTSSSAGGDHTSLHVNDDGLDVILSNTGLGMTMEKPAVDDPSDIMTGCRWECGSQHCNLNHLHQGSAYLGCDCCDTYVGRDLKYATHLAPEVLEALMGPRRDLVDEERPYKVPRVYVASPDWMDVDTIFRSQRYGSGGGGYESDPHADRDKRCHDLYVHDSDSDGD